MSTLLNDFSTALADAVTGAGEAVVRVEARRRLPATGIVWSEDGTIITANHVVRHDERINIGLGNGEQVKARLIGRDPTTDVAVLQADAGGLSPLVEAGKADLAVGQFTLALGRPGKNVQATLGIISALGEQWRTRMGGPVDRYIHTDVVMYPGFSGGPLINANGRLVGMNTSAAHPGVSLAIPTMTLARVAESLLAHGHIRRGYLGVSTQRARLPEAVREAVGQKSGLLIVSVEPGSPAEKGGLTLGDTIVALADQPVRRHDDLLALLTGDRVGQATPVKIVRGGQVQMLEVILSERPKRRRG